MKFQYKKVELVWIMGVKLSEGAWDQSEKNTIKNENDNLANQVPTWFVYMLSVYVKGSCISS